MKLLAALLVAGSMLVGCVSAELNNVAQVRVERLQQTDQFNHDDFQEIQWADPTQWHGETLAQSTEPLDLSRALKLWEQSPAHKFVIDKAQRYGFAATTIPSRGGWYYAAMEVEWQDEQWAATVATPAAPVVLESVESVATRYGESYNGQTLHCEVYGVYDSTNVSIVAVPPARYDAWPCGTKFWIRGAAGSFEGVSMDRCPGCGSAHVDLSEAGIAKACGDQADRCNVTVEVLQ